MGLEIIPSDISQLTDGEKRLLNKLKKLYEDIDRECFLYVQPRIRNQEPDFILIDSSKGVAIFEVKDWSISYIKSINKRKVQTIDGKEFNNPVLKANQYYNLVNGVIGDIDSLINDYGELNIMLKSFAILSNISEEELKENEIENQFPFNPSKLITSKDIRKLEINDIFQRENINIDISDITAIRASIFPEIRVITSIKTNVSDIIDFNKNKEEILALDSKQEQVARRIPYGHYMVTGVPGSGKTVILLARAIHLIKENPDWRIKILTYNKSLKAKLEGKLDKLANELQFHDINIDNIEISTFHSLALNVADVSVPHKRPKDYFDVILPELALENARPIYDAILIDEYQDFRDSWIKLCVKLCKENNYKLATGEEKRGINMFLAGDRLQSIYNSKEHSWVSLGIDMRGRSKLLKSSYRVGGNHIKLALEYLLKDDKLKEEVEKFYEGSNNIESNRSDSNSAIEFLIGSPNSIVDKIRLLLNKVNSYSDILVLCKDWKSKESFKDSLSNDLIVKCNFNKEFNENKINITTYHSSKGLEAPICILLDVDKFEETNVIKNNIEMKKLLYVGMTRASNNLIIHGNIITKSNCLSDIKNLSQTI